MRPEGAPDVRIGNPIGIISGAGGGRNAFGRSYSLQGNFHWLSDPGLKAWAIDL
jgi:hypothetical protein